jgi:hypothetical protein
VDHPAADHGGDVLPRQSPRRIAIKAVRFHGIGVALTAVAVAAGLWAWVVATFLTSVCGDVDRSDELLTMRMALLVIGGAVGAVPLKWGLYARRKQRAWVPWAAVAGAFALSGLVAAVLLRDVARWCMF